MAATNGTMWKATAAVLGLLLTAALILAGANQGWGRQAEKVQTLEVTVGKHAEKIECHDREIATLATEFRHVLEQQRQQTERLDELVRSLNRLSRAPGTAGLPTN